jgi:hypothetical protein
MNAQRGVDIDAIAIFPSPERAALEAAIRAGMNAHGFDSLASIDDVKLDALLEWCEPSERCVAITLPRTSDAGSNAREWRLLYDTEFSSAQLAQVLSAAFPKSLIVYFNIQESTDATLALYRANAPLFVLSANAAAVESLNAGGTKSDALTLSQSLPGDLLESELAPFLESIIARIAGEKIKPHGPRSGGVYDAMQSIARRAGMPKLYRFFEGWLRSDLDWDEDDVETVLAFRKK